MVIDYRNLQNIYPGNNLLSDMCVYILLYVYMYMISMYYTFIHWVIRVTTHIHIVYNHLEDISKNIFIYILIYSLQKPYEVDILIHT